MGLSLLCAVVSDNDSDVLGRFDIFGFRWDELLFLVTICDRFIMVFAVDVGFRLQNPDAYGC